MQTFNISVSFECNFSIAFARFSPFVAPLIKHGCSEMYDKAQFQIYDKIHSIAIDIIRQHLYISKYELKTHVTYYDEKMIFTIRHIYSDTIILSYWFQPVGRFSDGKQPQSKTAVIISKIYLYNVYHQPIAKVC